MRTKNQEGGLVKDLIWGVRRAFGSPDNFMIVSKDTQGEYQVPRGYFTVQEVGNRTDVHYLHTNNIPYRDISWELTKFNYYQGKKANAFHIVETHPNGSNYDLTTVIPLRAKVRAIVNQPTQKSDLVI